MLLTKKRKTELNKIIYITKKYYSTRKDEERIYIKQGVYNYDRDNPLHLFLMWLKRNEYDDMTQKRCEYLIHAHYKAGEIPTKRIKRNYINPTFL